MNRIEKYYHGYDCQCDACRNCEPAAPQEIARFVAMPVEVLVSRDQKNYAAGREHESLLAQAAMEAMRRETAVRVEAAYHEGKATMAVLCLVAGVCIAIAKIVLG